MITKRGLIVLLVGLNALLVVALLFQFVSLPRAYAQAGGGPMAVVTAKAAGQSFDVLYVVRGDALHAFYPANFQTKKHAHAATRDLKTDFEKK